MKNVVLCRFGDKEYDHGVDIVVFAPKRCIGANFVMYAVGQKNWLRESCINGGSTGNKWEMAVSN